MTKPPARASDTPPPIENRVSELSASDSQMTRHTVFYKKLIRFEGPEPYATLAQARLVAALLASQLSGSLHEAIVDKSKLSPTTPYLSFTRIAPATYALTITADVNEEQSPDGKLLREAIAAYVAGLGGTSFSERSIERIRKRLLEQHQNADTIPAEIFQRLITWLAQGHDPDELNRFPERITAVRGKDVNTLLTALAGPGRVVSGILAPQAGGSIPGEQK